MTTTVYSSLKGKRVIVTGGGSGIGAGIVRAFATQGAAVQFIDVAVAPSRALVTALAEAAVAPVFHECDLADLAAVKGTLA